MVMAPELQSSESPLSFIATCEDAAPSPYIVCARTDSRQVAGSPVGEATTCRRRRRQPGKDAEPSNLAIAVYSVCCICQFISYLPLLVLRVCFGCQQQQQQQQDQRQRKQAPPGLRTLIGLMLIGLPLMMLASLPIVGRFVSLITSPPDRKGNSRTSSVSSSRRSYSISSESS